MPPRNQSLRLACLVLVAALGWILCQPPAGGPRTALPPPAGAPGTAALARPPANPASPTTADRTETPEAGGGMTNASVAGPTLLPVNHREKEPVVSIPLPGDFLRRILAADESAVRVSLPGGGTAQGLVSLIRRDEHGLLLVQGTITRPEVGRFMFQRQTIRGKAGSLVGFIHYDKGKTAYQVRPIGEDGGPALVKTTADSVMCRAYAAPPVAPDEEGKIPAAHPIDDPIPPGENQIIQLQSLPGATAVIYLDFDGEERNFAGWGYINAQPSGASNAQIFDVWQGVCEDYQPFQINVTTVRAVYDAAPPGHRIQVVVTPTSTAAPGFGGVAYIGSFNWSSDMVCWSFFSTGKNAVEVISHEVGHTLGLRHHGEALPYEEYYHGHNGWAPIMGSAYLQPLTQWSKGEYTNANNPQDDLQIIGSNNNGVTYRADDHGGSFAASSWLDIATDGTVFNEGVIGLETDQDSFRFSTSGGTLDLQIDPVPPLSQGPGSPEPVANLDIKAEILNSSGAVITTIATSDSPSALGASFAALYLTSGDYFLRLSGTGRGDPADGYSAYASLGSYTITGTVDGGVHTDRFLLAENSAAETLVGTVVPRVGHGGGTPYFTITSGNPGNAFAMDPATGTITVADPSQLDFETLSSRWDDPADFELFVTVADNLGVFTESIRVLITLADVNEAPVFPTPSPVTVPSSLIVGTEVATIAATDPDRGDYVIHAIVAGNEGGHFAIHPATGRITLAVPLDFQVTPVHQLTIRATDHLSPVNEVDATVSIQLFDVPEGFEFGSIIRTFFEDIDGTSVADLTDNPRFPNRPDSEVLLGSFDSKRSHDDQYGSTVRGYLFAPGTGEYTFWISANESAELLISTDTNPLNAVTRASLASSADPGDWTLEPGQQSTAIQLTAGGIYYIEARHKDAFGKDHVQVAWQGPGMASRKIIAGTWLAPYRQPYAPWAPDSSFTVRESAATNVLVGRVSFTEPNLGQQVASHAITGGNGNGIFTIDPVSGEIRVADGSALVAGGRHVLTVSATDDGSPALTGNTTVTIDVISLSERLHAWWQLDESSGSTLSDSSNSQRAAHLSGGGSWIPRGAANQALQLNGIDARVNHFGTGLSGGTSFTAAAWVKIPVTHNSDAVVMQQASGNGGIGDYRIKVKADGRIRFSIHGLDAEQANEGFQFEISSSNTVNDGNWHHVACVRDGTGGRIFIDGMERAAGSGAIRMLDQFFYTTIGSDTNGQSSFLDGALDDIRIYEEALGGNQIAKVASTPKIAITSPVGNEAVIPPAVGLILEAAASDPDGPDPPISWSQLSGPGSVIFGSSAALFPTPGIYTLRATATDGINSAADDLTVVAGSSASSEFAGSAYGPGTNGGNIRSGPDSFMLYGASGGIDGGGTSDGFYLLGQNFTGDFDLRTRIARIENYEGEEIGSAGLVIRQGTTGAADEAGGFIGFDAVGNSGRWVRRAVTGESSVQTVYGVMPLPKWCRLTRAGDTVEFWHSDDGSSWVSRGTMTIGGEVRAGLCWSSNNTLVGGTACFEMVLGFASANTGAAVNAGGDFTAETGVASGLSGLVTDDGLPDPPALTSELWSVVGGPGGVALEDASLPGTNVTFNQAGIHVLRLVADDGEVKTFDDVTITVLNGNDPPVFAEITFSGSDAMKGIPYTGSIAGSASDPDAGDTLIFSKTDGPGWLLIAEDGTLSGTPPEVAIGPDSFTVRATDAAGAYVEATLEIAVLPTVLYLDANGSDPGSGAPAAVDWDGSALWSAGPSGESATYSWVSAATAVLSAGGDAEACVISVSGTQPLAGLVVEEGEPVLAGGALALVETAAVFDIATNTVIESQVTGANLVKSGPGTLVLAHPENSLTGMLAVTTGTLDLTGELAVAGGVTVDAGATLTGGGVLAGSVTVSGTLAPGNGTGTLTTGMLAMVDSPVLVWHLADWAGTAGTGHDLILADALNLTSAATVTVVVDATAPVDFSDQAASFTLLGTTSGITGFDAGKFVIDATALPAATGHWTLRENAGVLLLDYTPLTPFEAWQRAEFSTDSDDPLIAGPQADPDHDGMVNLLEYATGSSPLQAGSAKVDCEMVPPQLLFDPENPEAPPILLEPGFLRVTFHLDPTATDLVVLAETSEDLSDPDGWSDATLFIEEILPNRIVLREIPSGPHRFFRLRVTR